jgi:RecB family exonuclease
LQLARTKSFWITEQIPWSEFAGLKPGAWLCVGSGFVREEVKAFLLGAGHAFVSDAVTTTAELSLKIARANSDRVLTSLARQEVLRVLLAERRISEALPELKRLRRQSGFFKKLDRAIQGGRLASAHSEERAVYADRLRERLGDEPVREEVERLHAAYEAWLEALNLWDQPRVFAEAARVLEAGGGVAADLRLPSEIFLLRAQQPESLERAFLDALSRQVSLRIVEPPSEVQPEFSETVLRCERWHTIDDAAEALAERLLEVEKLSEQVVLIPDLPAVRRSLKRALDSRGLSLAEPRDPTRLRWDESLKRALLPLELVARRFERATVISWLCCGSETEIPAWLEEINNRGVRAGLGSYAGGKLVELHKKLENLLLAVGGRKTCAGLGAAWLAELKRNAVELRLEPVMLEFLAQSWKAFDTDMSLVGFSDRTAHPLYWLERFELRLQEASPPVERLKPRDGIRLYRLGQPPLASAERLFILGLPTGWLAGDGVGDLWYGEREREVLAAEFAVRSAIQVRQERLATLRNWLLASPETVVLDANYDWDGREREALAPLWRDLGLSDEAVHTELKGAHKRWQPGFSAFRPMSPQKVVLPPFSRSSITATDLENYSRCPFRALAGSRWRLRDGREASEDLWPDVRGNILHAALGVLVRSRSEDGEFGVSPSEALERAWAEVRPRGLLRSERLERYARASLLGVLFAFCEKERDYVKRAKTRVMSLEGPRLVLELAGSAVTVTGVPDRIDEHDDGIFIIDYKTSTQLPKGPEMVEEGYRMQLPFYALAARAQLGREVLGVQFIELSRKGGRANGIFFSKLNGKGPGMLTHTRSSSVLKLEPSEAWACCEESIRAHLAAYLAGEFEARPKKDLECRSCPYGDFCGRRRVGVGEA